MAKKDSTKLKEQQPTSNDVNNHSVETRVIRRPGLRSATRMQQQQNNSAVDGVVNGKLPKSPPRAGLNGHSQSTFDADSWPNKEDLVLWKSPFTTLNYFSRELVHQIFRCFLWAKRNYHLVIATLSFAVALYIVCKLDGAHQKYVLLAQKQLLWWGYWVGLGVLSSIGLGTGLHTFVLYLGPHIAAVTLAAYECDSLNFPEPPYPNEIICPEDGSKETVTLFKIISKVRVEAFMWGAGTAIGELPPYFMARAARLSGQTVEDLDLESNEDDGQAGFNGRKFIKNLVEKAGFFGILACASIPNPLFDLAGITCGHFLVPFWTFFGATLIGKAVIKMLIQKIFVIIAFNEHHFETFVEITKSIPYVGHRLNEPFREFLIKQKESLHRHAGEQIAKQPSWLAWIFEKFVLCMVAYFLVSIVNSMAQSCLERHKSSSIKTASTKRSKKSK